MPVRMNQQRFSIDLGNGQFCDVDVNVGPPPPEPRPPEPVYSQPDVQGPMPVYAARTGFVVGGPCGDDPRPLHLDFIFSIRKEDRSSG